MILLIGFPKCGTSSFQHLFQMLGLRSIHHDCCGKFIGHMILKNKLKNKKLLSGLESYDCITQMDVSHPSSKPSYWPQLFDFKQLYKEYPDSLFIFNTRHPENLLRSFRNWKNGDIVERLHTHFPELLPKNDDRMFIKLVTEHFSRVTSFFTEQKTAKFIVFDIEKDCVTKLSPYIDLKGIKFPHKNKSSLKK